MATPLLWQLRFVSGVDGGHGPESPHRLSVCEVLFQNEKRFFDYRHFSARIVPYQKRVFISMHGQTCGHASMLSLCVCAACFACMCYGLVTGTCLHSSTARGRLSQNSPNPTGACVFCLPSPLPSGLAWRGWRWRAAGRRL